LSQDSNGGNLKLMTTDKIDAIHRTAMFGKLGERELRAVADQAIVKRVRQGECLFREGEEARGLYVVVQGAIRAFRESGEGREQVIHVEHAGATVGDVPMFDGGPFPSTAVADEDSVVLFIAKQDLRRLCMEYPQIALSALEVLAGRLRRAVGLIEALSLREADQRLARLLLSEARLRGRRTETGIEFELAMTNQQIAARIGTVREVVSRALGRLQVNQLIVLDGRKVSIADEAALEVYAGK
jgi:CRP-like cAMP-binding protein